MVMTRLDRHVSTVRNKLALDLFFHRLAWALLIFFSAVLVAVIVDKLFHVRPPAPELWLGIGSGTAALAAVFLALRKRPTPAHAALAIDEKLALKEKFSTALSVRNSADPFAKLAVRDAENSANNVSLNKQFPLTFPRVSYATASVLLACVLVALFVQPVDLFGRVEAEKKQIEQTRVTEETKKQIEKAIATVDSVAKAAGENEQIRLARNELAAMLKNPISDPARAKLTAAKALSDVSEAVKEQVKNSQKFANAQSEAKAFGQLQPPADEDGPVAKAHNAMAKGDFDKAVKDLQDAAQKFDQMTPEEKEKAAQQMKNLAQQLQQMAQDPTAKAQLENKMKELGADKDQATAIADAMQKAAAGDKDAQKQLEQMQKQMQDQLTNNPGLNKEQQQAMRQMVKDGMKQAQAKANTQQTAQNMAEAGIKMAQAMRQAADQNGDKQGKEQQANAQQGGPDQKMQEAQQAMADQLQQMDAVAKDAQAQQAAQQAAAGAAQQAAQGMNGQQPGNGPAGNQPGGAQAAGGQSDWKEGDPNGKQGGGAGGPGQGAGDRSQKQAAPFSVKQEVSPSQEDEKGRILASTFVKAGSIKGESKAQLQQALESSEKEATDEVDQERVSRQNQKVVREYFESMQQDAR